MSKTIIYNPYARHCSDVCKLAYIAHKKKLCTLILMIKLDNSLTTENRQMSSGSEQSTQVWYIRSIESREMETLQ